MPLSKEEKTTMTKDITTTIVKEVTVLGRNERGYTLRDALVGIR